MNPFVARLFENTTALESAKIRENLETLEQLRQESLDLSTDQWLEGLGRMAPLRLKSSGSLSRGTIDSWQKANLYITQKIQEGLLPTWEDILQLNSILLNSETRELRKVSIYLGADEACPMKWLEDSVDHFKDFLLKIENHPDPVIAAALCQYILVSIHPFIDGNGRTANLLADWILGLHAYLPLSFETRLNSFTGSFLNKRTSATPGNAILKLIKNLSFSYQLVLDSSPQK